MMTKEDADKWARELKEDADKWARELCENGTYPLRMAYKENFGIGEAVEGVYHDPLFTLGVEYGLLIAIAKIYNELSESVV